MTNKLPYTPACPLGYTNCIYDPAYILHYYPDWYNSLYGYKPTWEVVKHCFEAIEDDDCSLYDDEDK